MENLEKIKKLVLLHSNDMHGDFFAEEVDSALIGGISMLSGYVHKVRNEEENTLYLIAGDMLQGSIIDAEFRGISTIDIMNVLNPDVATIGNHETDYGFAHLMFLERCASFPIVNANLHVKPMGTRLFEPYIILKVNGIRVLVIGIITKDILKLSTKDVLLSDYVEVKDPATEVRKICNSAGNLDVDLTVLLTHIGFEEDLKLAAELDPNLSVDLIIGGHTHTIPEKPAEVNGILVVQAGVGTDQIGRFDLELDLERHKIHRWDWKIVPINDENCPRDELLDMVVAHYHETTEEKYNAVITRMPRDILHPDRRQETELGNLLADIFREQLGVDLFLLGSGSVRSDRLKQIVTLKSLREIYPFDDELYSIWLLGEDLERMLKGFFTNFVRQGTHEFYQVSEGTKIVFDSLRYEMMELQIDGDKIDRERIYRVGMQYFHFKNAPYNFDLEEEVFSKIQPPKLVSTSSNDIIEEYFLNHFGIQSRVEGRIVIF